MDLTQRAAPRDASPARPSCRSCRPWSRSRRRAAPSMSPMSLLRAGARALIAGDDGPLVDELTTAGGEWIPMVNATVNPLRLRRNARELEHLIAQERIDIVHAYDAGAAWSARIAAIADRGAGWSRRCPMCRPIPGCAARYAGALAQGDRMIAPSNYAAAPIIAALRRHARAHHHRAARDRHREVRSARACRPSASTRCARPGASRPTTGSCWCPDASRRGTDRSCCPMSRARLLDEGIARISPSCSSAKTATAAKYARKSLKRAQAQDVDDAVPHGRACRRLPAAFAAADVVAVPAIEPPVLGRVVAQAQAMGRPVVTSDVGMLPEHMVAPPRMPEDVRTGWVATAGDPADFARALTLALALDRHSLSGGCPRARGNSRNTCFRRRALPTPCGRLYVAAGA